MKGGMNAVRALAPSHFEYLCQFMEAEGQTGSVRMARMVYDGMTATEVSEATGISRNSISLRMTDFLRSSTRKGGWWGWCRLSGRNSRLDDHALASKLRGVSRLIGDHPPTPWTGTEVAAFLRHMMEAPDVSRREQDMLRKVADHAEQHFSDARLDVVITMAGHLNVKMTLIGGA